MSSADPLLSLTDVDVHFRDGGGGLSGLFSKPDVVQAVNGVSLDIYERDVVALVGESGCGKTTLGKTAIGLQEPTNGSVEYRGHDIWEARRGNADVPFEEVRSALQIIHQDPGSSLNPNTRVKSILKVPLQETHPGMGSAERLERIYSLLEHVGMTPATDYAERYPHQLSGGEKQRVALCRALLMNPDLILADEAISALDVSLRVEMMDLMLDLQDEFDTSYLFISHDLSNARYFAEHGDGRIGGMYLGDIVEIGPAEVMTQDPAHPYTEVLRWGTPSLDPDDRGGDEMPMRTIDIPDPVDPPSGCRFHTRCPNAREACSRQAPAPRAVDDGGRHRVSCFRVNEQHEYWESAPLDE